jgi:hypothetical protein
MGTAAPFKCPVATIVLAVQSSYPAACDTTGRVAGCTCIVAPGETTGRAGNRLMLAAAV